MMARVRFVHPFVLDNIVCIELRVLFQTIIGSKQGKK